VIEGGGVIPPKKARKFSNITVLVKNTIPQPPAERNMKIVLGGGS
jgi:hypothetical protein